MHTPITTGNWKSRVNPEQTVEFVNVVKGKLLSPGKVESVIAAPAVDLYVLKKTAEGSDLHTDAENAYFEAEGAFTGKTSPKVLNETGVGYCIIGHSERCGYFRETNEDISKKVKALFTNGATPIICCDESLETRRANKQGDWIATQVKAAPDGLTAEQVSKLVIAYEPIWVIGIGETASADQTEGTCKAIRETIKGLYNEETAENVRIQHGGSVRPANVKELMSKPDIDGGLVGGASLDPGSFLALVNYQN